MSKTFVTLAAFLAAFAVLSTRAPAADDAKYVKLVNARDGKVLSIAGDSEDNEAKAVVAKDDAATNKSQQWQLVKDGGYYKILNRKSGKVLDVNNESADEGADIIQWDDKTDGNDNQRWTWDGPDKDKADKPRQLKSKSSHLVLDVTTDGYVVQNKADEKAKGQMWTVVEVKE